jgi:hypothetical protein
VSSNLPKSHEKLPPGIQLPSINPEVKQDPPVEVPGRVLNGKGTSDWIMAADFVEEYAMAAEIRKTEALEPHNVAEANHSLIGPYEKKPFMKNYQF